MRHRFHALCPYFAMFPETFAETWISRLTSRNEVILDPFCGRGTLPFQALLMGRRAVGCDINSVAFCVTKAKTNAPPRPSLYRRIRSLENAFEPAYWERARRSLPLFFHVAYRSETLRQLLYLRETLRWRDHEVDCMLAALVLGSLHGESNRSSAFLSNQMPHTISTKPDYSVRFWKKRGDRAPKRDVFELLRERVVFRYETPPPSGSATIMQIDMRDLPRVSRKLPGPVRCVITSPPYLDVTSYEEDQWLRRWFLGGVPGPARSSVTDDRPRSTLSFWNLMADMWRALGRVIAPRTDVVLRVGATRLRPEQLVEGLLGTAALSERRVRLVGSEISEIQRRQTDAFRPGSRGCLVEVDCHFSLR